MVVVLIVELTELSSKWAFLIPLYRSNILAIDDHI